MLNPEILQIRQKFQLELKNEDKRTFTIKIEPILLNG